jgi:2,3-bisphosphoglycerate-independent phosphoglycerate mutase
MKYIIIIGDGMADRPLAALGGKTLLEACVTPNLDKIAREGCGGLVQTIPDSCEPGSDVANLSIIGYDPTKYYTGRAPLEAVSMGKKLNSSDVAFRCNLVTVEGEILADYCAGHITSEEGKEVIDFLQNKMGTGLLEFVPGVSYRHLLVVRSAPKGWRKGKLKTVPPHDFTGKKIADFLPVGENREIVIALMNQAKEILSDCPVNKKRISEGKKPASGIWLWGQGGAVALPSLKSAWNIEGAVISAVDLLKGIGISAGLQVENVEGATGFIDTNYKGKVERTLSVLSQKDFVYLHVEAPDEAGHSGNWKIKKQAIEDFDSKIVGPVLAGLSEFSDYRLMVLPDHATPIEIKTHSREAVPFIIYPAPDQKPDSMKRFTEKEAEKGRYHIQNGPDLFRLFMKGV